MKFKHLVTKTIIKLSFIAFISFTAILLVCYILGPPKIDQSFETILYTENGNPYTKKPKRNQSIELSEHDNLVSDITVIVEDKKFYDHFGFDIKRIIRAFTKNISHLRLKEGASTITQQYARNLYLTHDKTWKRKIKEALYTIRLEMFYTKEEILEGYLNTIYYGHGVYGIEQASQYYFNKQVNELSVAQISLLVGIPKGPTYYSPFNNKENAFKRQNYILNLLLKQNIINKTEYNKAIQEDLQLTRPEEDNLPFAPYFTDYVFSEAATILNVEREDIDNNGYKIYTTINEQLQLTLEQTIKEQIDDKSEIEVGALTIEPESGEIKAMAGGRSYKKSAFNRTIQSQRLVGSTIKPIIYYAALENGFTPSTMLKSEPTTFTFDQNKTYAPRNYNNYYANKPITMTQAIALSDNIYAVKTNMFLGIKEVIQTAEKFGIISTLPEVPSFALGSAAISVNEMSQTYGIISNGGKKINNHSITKIIDRHGKTVYKRRNGDKQLFDRKKMFILSDLLTGMFDTQLNGHMEVTGSSISQLLTHKYAGKSGTTETDSWMIGYSPSLVTSVWTGYDDNRNMNNMIEKSYAKKIWAHFMEKAHKDIEEESIKVPEGIVGIPLDHETGKIATKHCPTNRLTYFEKGTEPKQFCQIHRPTKKQPDITDEDNNKFFKRIFDLFF